MIGSESITCRLLILQALGVTRPISDEGETLLVVKARQMSRCPARARDIVTGSRKRASQALRLGVLGTRQEKSLILDGALGRLYRGGRGEGSILTCM